MENKLHILCTAPVDSSLIQQAAANDVVIDVVSFIAIEPVQSDALSEKIAPLYKERLHVIFTSMNAVAALPVATIDWKVYCIGHATQKAIEDKFGNHVIAGTANNAGELADLIINDTSIKEVVFFCGDIRRDELPEKLTASGIKVEEIIVYKTIAIPEKINKHYDSILFFSPSAVNSFFNTNTIDNTTTLFAIGKTTASEIQKFSNNKTITSGQPDKKAMLQQVLAYNNKPSTTIEVK